MASHEGGLLETGRLFHERLMVEIPSKARTVRVGAESVRTLGRLVVRVLREFLENHRAKADAWAADAWAKAPNEHCPSVSLREGRMRPRRVGRPSRRKVAGPVSKRGRSLDFAASTAVACLRFVMREHLLAILAVPHPHRGGAPPACFRPSAFKLPGRGLF